MKQPTAFHFLTAEGYPLAAASFGFVEMPSDRVEAWAQFRTFGTFRTVDGVTFKAPQTLTPRSMT